jgi:hypothetical protein
LAVLAVFASMDTSSQQTGRIVLVSIKLNLSYKIHNNEAKYNAAHSNMNRFFSVL